MKKYLDATEKNTSEVEISYPTICWEPRFWSPQINLS